MSMPLVCPSPAAAHGRPPVYGSARLHGVIGTILSGAGVFLFFALLSVVLFRAWIPHLNSALIGPPEDNMQDFWNSWYAAVASNRHAFFYTNLIRFPQGTPLNYHSFAYPQLGLLVLLTKIFGTDRSTLLLLHNLMLLLSFPLAGTGAFVLIRHFVKSPPAALAGAFVFAFNPSHVAHVMHHAGVASIEFFPFFVVAYLRALEHRSASWLAAAIGFYALCALSCWYYLFYVAFFIAFHTIYLRVRDDRFPSGWRLFVPVVSMAGATALLSPLLVPMIHQSANPNAYSGGMNLYVADVAAYFAFPPTHLLGAWGSGLYAELGVGPWETTVYLGLVNVALLVWLGARTRLRDPVLVYVLCGMATFCVLASGETLHAFGHAYLFVHMPDIVFHYLPFLANLRAPSRAVVMVYLFLSIGVARALAQMEQDLRIPAAKFAVTAAVTLIVLDFTPAHLAMTDARCLRGLGAISSDREAGFGVLNLPVGYDEGNAAMLEATCHGRPIVGGTIARVLTQSLADKLSSDIAVQRAQLIAAHVKYVVVTSPSAGLFISQDADILRSRYERLYRPVFADRKLTVLRVY